MRRLLPSEGEERKEDSRSARSAGAEPLEGAFRTSTAEAASNLRQILAGEGSLVTTGQQPVLFLGPCLVLYKALTAIALAERLEADTGRPHLAAFWIASDDHDWEEVAVARLLDQENRLQSLRLEPPAGWAGRPVGCAPLGAAVSSLVDDLSQFLPDSEFVTSYIQSIQDAWKAGRPIGEAFALTLLRVLGDRPLACIDASASELKSAAVPLMRWALDEAEAAEGALKGGADLLSKLGYEPPIPLLEGATLVFLDTGEARERLYRERTGFRTGRAGAFLECRQLMTRLEDDPTAFSPNVALRPVLESALLPVAAAVLGPGEIAYWSQLGELFRRAGVRRPAVRPRAGWTLIETKVDKVLNKLELDPEGLEDGGRQASARVTRSTRPVEVDEALAALRSSLGHSLERVETAIGASLPGIRSAVGKARAEAFRTLAELEAQVDSRVRLREEAVLAQIRKAALHLFPDGQPQERVQSPLYYLARYGPGLLEALDRETRHRVAGREGPG